jgi:two-component system, OmpR family, osmolarity sensor histidine kinase EnvZ
MVASRETGQGIGIKPSRYDAALDIGRRSMRVMTTLLSDLMPKGLYARALIIIIAPIVLLQCVVAYTFMERHWQAVTRRLVEATVKDIAALNDLYDEYKNDDEYGKLIELARDRLKLWFQVLPPDDLPGDQQRPFFSLLDRALSREINLQIKHPFWLDTVGNSDQVEIRIKRDRNVLRFVAKRSQTYASNSHIFLIWMVGTSVVLLCVAILFLRNQIRPILRLADAADAFGKGRPTPANFTPRGAREVRAAAQAFIEMRDRIKQHVDQRTTMLAGISHDLRTILTRYKLQLELLGDIPEAKAMNADVNEMWHMLEDYLAFTRGDGGEEAAPTVLRDLLEEIYDEASIYGVPIDLKLRRRRKDLELPLKRQAFKRAITNLVSNAARYGNHIVIRAATERGFLRVEVDDDGPGIPVEERENVFRPFYRIDKARSQSTGHSGLGLAIAKDIAISHGGNVILGESSMGGLRAIIRVPL